MKNKYLTSYFPLMAILLFSLSFSIIAEKKLQGWLLGMGVYEGMKEFFPEAGIKLAMIIVCMACCFMIFAALKLIADTINGLSLLFFSKDESGEAIAKSRSGSVIFLAGGALSLFSFFSFYTMLGIFLAASVIYFIYFVYISGSSFSPAGLIGIIFFQVISWASLLSILLFLTLKLYNSVMASLPV
jgi:Family of unknown function (DUF5366)